MKNEVSKANLKVFTQNFKIVQNKRGLKFLQFTRTWVLEHPLLGPIGDSIDHCIAFYKKDGTLKWNPPTSYIPEYKMKKQLHSMTTPLYNLVCQSLEKSGHLSKLNIIDFSEIDLDKSTIEL